MWKCDICGTKEADKHLDIYLKGSEGIIICTTCNLRITDYARNMASLAHRVELRVQTEIKKETTI